MKEIQHKLTHTSYFKLPTCPQVRALILVILLFAGCRSVIPARDLRSSSAPDISRIVLRKGDSLIIFNKDLGWYNKRAGTIEGVTRDSQHVEYRIGEINKIETVREYSIIPTIVAAGIVIGAVIYLVAKLFVTLL
jgi:hypothetical protein